MTSEKKTPGKLTLGRLTFACAAAAVVTAFVAGDALPSSQKDRPVVTLTRDSAPPTADTPHLRPDQKRLIEAALAGAKPSDRKEAYEAMAELIRPYSQEEVAALKTTIGKSGSNPMLIRTSAPPAEPAPAPSAPKLRPDQRRAVELSIAGTEPSMRPFMYEQMAKNLAGYDEKQIAALIKGLEANASKEQLAAANAAMKTDGPVEGALSAEDFAYNRAQYEPVIRKAWQAQKTFDAFVNAKRAAYCPNRDAVARFGSAWRYELVPFGMDSATASQNPDADVAVMGSSYAPQDGRYRFDFSKVRYTFDEKAVDAAVKEGCAAYAAEGVKFLARLDPMIAAKDWNGAHKLEQAAMGWVDPILDRMNGKLEKLSPNHGYPLMTALQNGQRIKS